MAADFVHKPVLLAEVLVALRPKENGRYADGTIGGAGHAAAILAASGSTGFLYGCDRDGVAVEAASARLAEFAGRFEIRQGNFSELPEWVPTGSCDGVLLDLGVSSPQLDTPERGFSFQQDAELDMRMDRRSGPTAAQIIESADAEELARIFWEYGGERESRRMARALVRARETRPIRTTGQLAEAIERVSPRRGRKTHPATKIFQALRIVVNDELGSLTAGLAGAMKILKPGGRLAVITFQGLETRILKSFGRDATRDYDFPGTVDVPELRTPRTPAAKWIERRGIEPGEAELAANPRSRSAILRVLEKI